MINFFSRYEPVFFFLLVLFGALPVLAFRYFPTLDGPAHQYNAELIRHLIKGDAPLLSLFFEFNHQILPNWTGHALLLFLGSFLPGYLTEKVLLLIYFIGLPFAFRYFIKSIVPERRGLCFLIFPFVHSYFLALGFYNFSLALIFLFLAFGNWINLRSSLSYPGIILQFILMTCVYFSHPIVFLLLLIALGLHTIGGSQKDFRKEIPAIIKKIGLLTGLSFPCLILFAIYFVKHHSTGENSFLSKSELFKMIAECRPLITLARELEISNTNKMFFVFAILFLVAIFFRIRSVRLSKQATPEKRFTLFTKGDSWLVMSMLVCILFFFLPDSDEQNGYMQAGFVSMRLCLLFYLFMLVWLCLQKLPTLILAAAIFVSTYFHVRQVIFHYHETEGLSHVAEECYRASLKIKPNTLVLPINNCSNWLLIHFSNYLGHEKPVMIMENYEATSDFFPLHYRYGSFPLPIIGSAQDTLCDYWNQRPDKGFRKSDYVFILGTETPANDICTMRLDYKLSCEYKLIYKGELVSLYELKKE